MHLDVTDRIVFAAREVGRLSQQVFTQEDMTVYLERLRAAIATMNESEYEDYLSDTEIVLGRDLTDDEANSVTYSHDHGLTVSQAIAKLHDRS